jgi:hypothetical protein
MSKHYLGMSNNDWLSGISNENRLEPIPEMSKHI